MWEVRSTVALACLIAAVKPTMGPHLGSPEEYHTCGARPSAGIRGGSHERWQGAHALLSWRPGHHAIVCAVSGMVIDYPSNRRLTLPKEVGVIEYLRWTPDADLFVVGDKG